MNIAAWIVSGVLAAVYLMAGSTKLTQPMEKLLERGMTFVEDFPPAVVRFIGIAEILGALGLILPKVTDIVDERGGVEGTLTGLAATGLVLIQVLAIPVHARRGEAQMIAVNVVLALLAAFVAAARFGWL